MAQLKNSKATSMTVNESIDVGTHIKNIESNLDSINTALDSQYIILKSTTTISSTDGTVPFSKVGGKGDGFSVSSSGVVTINSDDINLVRVNATVGMSVQNNRAWSYIYHNNTSVDSALEYGSYTVNKNYALIEVKKGDTISVRYYETGRLNADGLSSSLIIEKVQYV